MKQPRTSDFDPGATERALRSSMHDFPAIEHPQPVQPAASRQEPVVRVREGASAASGRRRIKPRHGFDIYEDQVEALKQLALEDRMHGGTGSMSAMVREALDDYLAKVSQLRVA